jgi:hypothetical protein
MVLIVEYINIIVGGNVFEQSIEYILFYSLTQPLLSEYSHKIIEQP